MKRPTSISILFSRHSGLTPISSTVQYVEPPSAPHSTISPKTYSIWQQQRCAQNRTPTHRHMQRKCEKNKNGSDTSQRHQNTRSVARVSLLNPVAIRQRGGGWSVFLFTMRGVQMIHRRQRCEAGPSLVPSHHGGRRVSSRGTLRRDVELRTCFPVNRHLRQRI